MRVLEGHGAASGQLALHGSASRRDRSRHTSFERSIEWLNETPSGTLARLVICMLGRRTVLGGVIAAAAAGIATRLGAPAAIAAQDDALPSWNDGAARTAILDFIAAATDEGERRVRPPGGSHRHLRPGRLSLGRASDLWPGGLRHRSRQGAGPGSSRVGDDRALRRDPLRRPEGHGGVHRAGLGADHRRHPRRDDGRGVPAGRRRVGRHGQGSALRPALHPAGLPADARSPEPAARQRLPHLHRLRRWAGVHPLLRGGCLRHPAGAGHRHHLRDRLRLWGATARRR